MPKFSNFLLLLLVVLACLCLSCGKKVDEEKSPKPRVVQPQLTDIELELSKQEVFCAADRTCPPYLTKIVVHNKNKLSSCTGFLISEDVVATASSCLPDTLRFEGMSCEKDLFFFFGVEGGKPLRVGCSKILKRI